MKSNKEIKDHNLDDVSGGQPDLEKYIKTISGKDKNKMLVDHGTGVNLDIDSTVKYEKEGNIYIILRDKPDAEHDE